MCSNDNYYTTAPLITTTPQPYIFLRFFDTRTILCYKQNFKLFSLVYSKIRYAVQSNLKFEPSTRVPFCDVSVMRGNKNLLKLGVRLGGDSLWPCTSNFLFTGFCSVASFTKIVFLSMDISSAIATKISFVLLY